MRIWYLTYLGILGYCLADGPPLKTMVLKQRGHIPFFFLDDACKHFSKHRWKKGNSYSVVLLNGIFDLQPSEVILKIIRGMQ